jgi:ubiquinone/menaquinone biosynthesis C-methylase UbiE
MQRTVALERMDDPAVAFEDLAANFDDIELANRRFGGIRPIVDEVFACDARWVLDVGCGSADVPRALLREARARGRRLDVVALDRSETALAIARDRAKDDPLLRFVRADATALPFPDDAFDVATCSLALHQFEPHAAVDVLRELRRVSRLTPVVSDLERSAFGYAAAVVYAWFVAKNALSKNDAPLSVKRAYTADELRELIGLAGWRDPVVRRAPYFRLFASDRG